MANIGLCYIPKLLGYSSNKIVYKKANMFKSLLTGVMTVVLLSIHLPVFGHLTDDHQRDKIKSLKAEQQHKNGEVTYLANEGLMITSGNNKILFDPFFHNDFGRYPLVPDSIRKAIFAGSAPYDHINAIFISHAHEDHFSAQDMQRFLTAHSNAHLFAPTQAIKKLQWIVGKKGDSLMKRTTTVSLEYGAKPWHKTFSGMTIDAVRIPHAGGRGRRDIENMVFRVTLDGNVTVMHMGDADPNDQHFAPYAEHWQQQQTDTAFPPYWFFMSEHGRTILNQRINAKEAIGVHVPKRPPKLLVASGVDFFSKPGEKRTIITQ
jgi:L-ascorbate metabolism protein UlaG (beta-lactamase superfamily)